MNVQTYVIDNFYNNPDEVRQYAMEQDFQTIGNFPTSLGYFGTNLENGRLFQTFFFDTEY
jgi:hypothetical protein